MNTPRFHGTKVFNFGNGKVKAAFYILNTSLAILIFISYGFAQDRMKIVSGDIFNVRITGKSNKEFDYIMLETGEQKKINRRFVKGVQYEYLTKQKVSISLGTGFAPFGTHSSLAPLMEKNGLGGYVSGWFWGGKSYPAKNINIPFSGEMEIFFPVKNSMTLAIGNTDYGFVEGIDHSKIFYSNPQIEVFFGHYDFSCRSKLEAGLLLTMNKLKEQINPNSTARAWESNQLKPGFHLGYRYSFIRKENFHLSMLCQFKYSGNVLIPEGQLKGEKLALNNLFFGIQSGLFINVDKKKEITGP